MMTIFGLFETFEEATTTVDELLEAGADASQLNALVKADVAKTAMDINLARAGVAVTDEVGEVELHGLERLVGAEQPVPLPALGDVYAAGELATLMVPTAQQPREDGRGLEAALREFQVADGDASVLYDGIDGGDWLVFVRTQDDAQGRKLLPLVERHTSHVATVTG